jgi:phosphatidate phosphatase APP1
VKTLAQILALLLVATAARAQTSNIKTDQTIAFFPGVGRHTADGKAWELQIRGCVYEFENRPVELTVFRAALGLEHVKMNADELATFKDRARLFLVDNKGGRKVVVQLGGKDYPMEKSSPNGHFTGTIRLTDNEVARLRTNSNDGRIQVQATRHDGHIFAGVVDLLDDSGITVISDIDDTIKITEVLRRNEMLRHTFLEPFQPVPGMAAAYQSWARTPGTRFDYVSASPWQLYLPLSIFIHSNGFPEGTFELKLFRLKDTSFLSLFESPETYKLQVIEPLLKAFPNQRFVFVGDSGERDPEAYSALARKYPRQVTHIFIRNVTNQGPDSPRFRTDFQGLPATLWQVFKDPAELPVTLTL